MKFFPFGITPAGLGLKGKDREKAKAYYELTGEELDRQLLEIEFKGEDGMFIDMDHPDYRKNSLKLDLKYNKLTEEEADYAELDVVNDGEKTTPEYILKRAAVDLKYDKIEQIAYDKISANVKGEPWVGYREYKLVQTEEGGTGVEFDLDWNDAFVDQLREEGYEGVEDELVVRKWYAEIARAAALDEGLALDIFKDDDEDGSEDGEGGGSGSPLIRKENLGDNKSKYS